MLFRIRESIKLFDPLIKGKLISESVRRNLRISIFSRKEASWMKVNLMKSYNVIY